jgi:hypothetical protein
MSEAPIFNSKIINTMALEKGNTVEKSKDEVPFKEDSSSTASKVKTPTAKKKDLKEFDPQELLDAMAKMQEKIDTLENRGYVEDDEYELTDDWLEQPVVFFCFSSWHGIYSDKRRGQTVLPPNGAIKFESLYRWKKRHGNTWKVISVSQFTSRSKEEVEWLESHSGFGFGFFKDIEEAKNINATFAQKQLEQHGIVSRMSDHAVIERAGGEGIAIKSADIDHLRRELTEILATKAIKSEKTRTEEGLKRNRAENAEVKSVPSHLKASESNQKGEGVY